MFEKIEQDCLDGVYDGLFSQCPDQNLDDGQLYKDVLATVQTPIFTEQMHQIIWEAATDEGVELGIQFSDVPELGLLKLYEKFYNFATAFTAAQEKKNSE